MVPAVLNATMQSHSAVGLGSHPQSNLLRTDTVYLKVFIDAKKIYIKPEGATQQRFSSQI
jgi:hypothetical protein